MNNILSEEEIYNIFNVPKELRKYLKSNYKLNRERLKEAKKLLN